MRNFRSGQDKQIVRYIATAEILKGIFEACCQPLKWRLHLGLVKVKGE